MSTTTIKKDKEKIVTMFLGCVLAPKRHFTDPFDFGDSATTLKHVKRRFRSFQELDLATDFGYFFGCWQDRWYIAIEDIAGQLTGEYEEFGSLEELKEVWMLD